MKATDPAAAGLPYFSICRMPRGPSNQGILTPRRTQTKPFFFRLNLADLNQGEQYFHFLCSRTYYQVRLVSL